MATATTLKIASWNVAGLRALFRKADDVDLEAFLEAHDFDVLCLQETKCDPAQAAKTMPPCVATKYPHRVWAVNDGTSQKKGLNGVALWSKTPPLRVHPSPGFDTEGRVVAVEYETFHLVTVYTPNSQARASPRFAFRVDSWDHAFRDYVASLGKSGKPAVICGDLNVAPTPLDYASWDKHRNQAAGLFDEEIVNLARLCSEAGVVDAFRHLHPDSVGFTYFSNFVKQRRDGPGGNGWRIDYFLAPEAHLVASGIVSGQRGSDHVPVWAELDFTGAAPPRARCTPGGSPGPPRGRGPRGEAHGGSGAPGASTAARSTAPRCST